VKTFSKSGFAVTALLLTVVACANSADVAPVQEAQPTEPAPAAKVPPSQPSAPTKTCAPSCATDADCQTSCPALAGGVQCCDTKAKTCFGSKTSACPVTTQPDAGADPAPAY
jgi:hypothetical protein